MLFEKTTDHTIAGWLNRLWGLKAGHARCPGCDAFAMKPGDVPHQRNCPFVEFLTKHDYIGWAGRMRVRARK
jgi:hypothetical protein